jgi:hypothetical protein
VVVAAFLWDLKDSRDVLYPFASSAIAAGAAITEASIEWRPIPEGTMTLPDLSDPVAAKDLPAGEPILPSAVSDAVPIPEGWWSVPVPLPATAVPGTSVHLVETASGFETDGIVIAAGTDGIVIAAGTDDVLSFDELGLVAVPPEAATLIAIAAREGSLVILLEP